MNDFFISYNKEDTAWAEWISWELEEAGYSIVLQAWDFRPGSNFVLQMQRASAQADRTIAVLSPDFLASDFTAPEWAAAFAKDPTGEKGMLIPVRVRTCDVEGLLPQIVYVDLVGKNQDTARVALFAGVKRGRAKPDAAPAFPGDEASSRPDFPGDEAQSQHTSPPGTATTVDQAAATAMLDRYGWGRPADGGGRSWAGNPWFGIVAIPERQGELFVDELQFGHSEFQSHVLRQALTEPGAIFRTDRATNFSEQLDALVLIQASESGRSPASILAVYVNGVLVVGTAIERRNRRSGGSSLADSMIIDEDAVRRACAAFAAFATSFYRELGQPTGHLFVGASLTGVEYRAFGHLPPYELQSITLPDHRLEDPLRIPTRGPLRVERTLLADSQAFSALITEHVARAFRVAGAYFDPDS